MSCWVKRAMNQLWRANTRLFIHRGVEDGKRTHGRTRAMAIRGMPRYEGDANWSKRLRIMVSFRIRIRGLVRLGQLVH